MSITTDPQTYTTRSSILPKDMAIGGGKALLTDREKVLERLKANYPTFDITLGSRPRIEYYRCGPYGTPEYRLTYDYSLEPKPETCTKKSYSITVSKATGGGMSVLEMSKAASIFLNVVKDHEADGLLVRELNVSYDPTNGNGVKGEDGLLARYTFDYEIYSTI